MTFILDNTVKAVSNILFNGNRGRNVLLTAASAFTLSMTLAGTAHGQVTPAACTPNPPSDGDTIVCDDGPDGLIGPIINTTVSDLTIVIAADNTVTGFGGTAIDSRDAVGDVTIDSSAATLVTGGNGIIGVTYGVGSVDITTGTTTGTAGLGVAAAVIGGAGEATIDTTAGEVTGATFGVYALNTGTGGVTVTTADTTGTAFAGIYAISTVDGDVAVDSSAGTVTGGIDGINGLSTGLGGVSITAADVEGTARDGVRANVTNYASTGDIAVDTTAGTVLGGTTGVNVTNSGLGSVTVAAGDVEGTYGNGISVSNYNATSAGDVTVTSTGAVTGGYDGVYVSNNSTGDVSVTTADVTGGANNGVAVYNLNADAGSIAVDTSAGSVEGVYTGVVALNLGAGDTLVTTADVSGGTGIVAANLDYANAGDVVVDSSAGTVTGDYGGATGATFGTGNVSVTTATVDTNAGEGIYATILNADSTGTITVDSSAGAVTSVAGNGILVNNLGAGAVSLTAGDVTGGLDGIEVDAGMGPLTINLLGDVTGADFGVMTTTATGTDLTLAAGQTVTGTTAGITTLGAFAEDTVVINGDVVGGVLTNAASDTVTLGSTGSVTGGINLGAGDDVFSDSSGNFDTVSGGMDNDIFNFDGGGRVLNGSGSAGDAISLFETFNFNAGGFTIGGLHTGLTDTNFNAGNNVLTGTLDSMNVSISSGAGLDLRTGSEITGDVTNSGTLNVAGGGVGNGLITGDFTQTATGISSFTRTSETAADLLTVTGDVTLGGTLDLNQTGFFTDTITLIDGGTGLFGNFSNVTGLVDGLLLSQSVELDAANFDVNLSTTFVDPATIEGLSQNEVNVLTALVPEFTSGLAASQLAAFATGIAGLGTVEQLSAAADEVTPEIANVGVEVFQTSQTRFMNSLLDKPTCFDTDDSRNGASGRGETCDEELRVWTEAKYFNTQDGERATATGINSAGYQLGGGVDGISFGPLSFGVQGHYVEFDAETDQDNVTTDKLTSDFYRIGANAHFAFNEGGEGLNALLSGAVAYADGDNDIDQNVGGFASRPLVAQTGSTDIDGIQGGLKLQMSGYNGRAWPIQPFVTGNFQNVSQDGFELNGPGGLSTTTESLDNTRYSVGYGTAFKHGVSERAVIRAGLRGIHYFGDTRANLTSRFNAASADTSFETLGRNLEDQFIGNLGMDLNVASSWTVGLDAYGELGDIEGFGGSLKLGKRF